MAKTNPESKNQPKSPRPLTSGAQSIFILREVDENGRKIGWRPVGRRSPGLTSDPKPPQTPSPDSDNS